MQPGCNLLRPGARSKHWSLELRELEVRGHLISEPPTAPMMWDPSRPPSHHLSHSMLCLPGRDQPCSLLWPRDKLGTQPACDNTDEIKPGPPPPLVIEASPPLPATQVLEFLVSLGSIVPEGVTLAGSRGTVTLGAPGCCWECIRFVLSHSSPATTACSGPEPAKSHSFSHRSPCPASLLLSHKAFSLPTFLFSL